MKKLLRWTGIAAGALVGVIVLAAAWVQLTWSMDHPDTPYPEIHASADPEVITQGEYLVHAVAHCSTCHGPYDPEVSRVPFGSPLSGGYAIEAGPFGTFTATNLTPDPTGIGELSDAELARAIRHGVMQDGTLSPMMTIAIGPMSDEDLAAVISYLRAQPAVEAEHPGPRFGFMARALSGRFGPRMDRVPEHVPAGEVSVERGGYLAMGPAACAACHTPRDPMDGFAPSGPYLSGAAQPEPDPTDPDFEIIAPNLTPAGHIAAWSEDDFVARMGAGRVYEGSSMPWEAHALLTEADVRSIYRYLRTLDPVERDTGPVRRERGSFPG